MTQQCLPSLAADFPASNRDQWRLLVDKVLKGGDYEKRLVSRSSDGLAIEPVYPRNNYAVGVPRARPGQPWTVVAPADQPDISQAASQALADLEGGADGLSLAFTDSAAARGAGLDAATVAVLDQVLSGVMLNLIALRMEPAADGIAHATRVASLIKQRGHQPPSVNVEFGFDPIGVAAGAGGFATTWERSADSLAKAIRDLSQQGFSGPFINCDMRVPHEAGATEAQELAYGLSLGVAYARALTAHGFSVADAYAALSWTVAMDADQLLGVAKLRALRKLWARIQETSKVSSRPIPIHAETAWRMLSQRDPAVNMLRSTLAAFTAGIGGADSISVLPHTLAFAVPDALARRIARNTQLVLLEEANLWRVADPAAGSGAVEVLTHELCSAAWSQFQDIERTGGIVECLNVGKLQTLIAAARSARMLAIATRKTPLTGTSEFPNLGEPSLVPVKSKRRRPLPAPQYEPLPSARLTEPFETLRDAADAHSKTTGARAKVFLANLGPVAEHGARATWIRNLLATGGIDAVNSDGFTASGDAGAAFAASGARVACICGTDETNTQLAEATTMALKSAGAERVLLAGRPGKIEDALKTAGIDTFVFAGQDVLAFLQGLHQRLGITR